MPYITEVDQESGVHCPWQNMENKSHGINIKLTAIYCSLPCVLVRRAVAHAPLFSRKWNTHFLGVGYFFNVFNCK